MAWLNGLWFYQKRLVARFSERGYPYSNCTLQFLVELTFALLSLEVQFETFFNVTTARFWRTFWNQHHNIRNLPKCFACTCCHCWSNAQWLASHAKVVKHEIQADRVHVIHQLFAKWVCCVCKTAHVHPHSQILTFYITVETLQISESFIICVPFCPSEIQ